MNNKLILELTVRLTQALDKNYDVVNMDTVLAVISALEGATITKEQLETTRLAKHINQLRRRNKSNILAIRAKNLLKKWREMFGITSQAQSEGVLSVTQQAPPTQQQTPKPPLSSTSQPASPYTAQLLGENFDNSLSSIGGGVEFSRTAAGGVSNTGSANFTFNKKSAALTPGEGVSGTICSSLSNGALADTQARLIKSSNRAVANNSSPSLPAFAAKVKHPTSFKNLIPGFNANNISKQTNSSELGSTLKVPQASRSANEREGTNIKSNLKNNAATYIVDDDDNQSQPSTTEVAQSGVSSPRTHKSAKRKDRDSIVMTYIENSSSPVRFESVSQEPTGRVAQNTRNNNVNNQVVTSTIDLQDSNSSSNFVNALCEVSEVSAGKGGRVGVISNSNKRLRKDKKRSNERVEQVTESEHFQPTMDESSRIAFPISGIQDYLSLSNSSMSIFPSQQTAGSGGKERYPTNAGSNDDNQPPNASNERNSELVEGDLTFAGKFKQSNSSSGIQTGSSSNYFSNGGENMSVTPNEFPCGNIKVAINNCRESVSACGTASTSTFLPFSRNSNESSSTSRTSQLDMIDVVNQDSQSMITVDDLRQQQQSSIEKNKTQRDVETVQSKHIKDNSSMSKQYCKEPSKSAAVQKPTNTSSSIPFTAASAPNSVVAITLTSPPAEQKVPKKRGRKKGSKGIDSVLAQSAGLSSQFLMSPALGTNKKVKTTMELLADIQNRKLGSATSSPTLMNWFNSSRPASSCSEPSLHSPRTSDACSTNATMSTAARSTPEKNTSNNSVAADELYESESDSNTSEPSHDSIKTLNRNALTKNSASKAFKIESDAVDELNGPISTIEEQIKELMALLPPVEKNKIDWETCEDVPCTCTLREVPPETIAQTEPTSEMNEGGSDLLKKIEDIKSENDEPIQRDDKSVISVSVLPLVQVKSPQETKLLSSSASKSKSEPVSVSTSPIVPSTNQKPVKSIFDLDFDDDNDPLHSFVEAASQTKVPTKSVLTTENGKIVKDEKKIKSKTVQESEHSTSLNIPQQQESSLQLEPKQEVLISTQSAPQLQKAQVASNDLIIPMQVNFPTYEVIEDPDCPAKKRYEVQPNQITKFHINAFHNCFIPNVNGNWDHSVPQNIDDESHHLENDSLYANVVPKYGCFVFERIPKNLGHVKFTKNFKPKASKESDKPPEPFLGVANIHRRQHFRLHSHRRLKTLTEHKAKKKRLKKTGLNVDKDEGIKTESIEKKSGKNDTKLSSSIHNTSADNSNLMDVDSDTKPVETETFAQSVAEVNAISVPDTNTIEGSNESNQEKSTEENCGKPMNLSDSNSSRKNGTADDFANNSTSNDAKKIKLNGNIYPLMNNNSIVKSNVSDETKCDISGIAKTLHNNTHNSTVDGSKDEEGIAASRRSSSCSNSSLKQNQNSINMKLRRHRLEQRQLEKEKQRRKREHQTSFSDVFDAEDAIDQTKLPPLVKRIKIVNGEYATTRRLTNSITDSSCLDEDESPSYCSRIPSESDIITEEEIDEDGDDNVIREGDDEDDFEEIVDDYDDDDGDDEEDAEEDYCDFHEVVTRDMTSSTTGNNHIVLTIKKTPSKTNSPSSSSMSPAPAASLNAKLSSISPTIQSTVDSLLLEDNALELSPDGKVSTFKENSNVELEKLLEPVEVKALDLMGNTDFLLPEPTSVSIYSFHVNKNGDNDRNNDGRENERAHESEEPEVPTESAEIVENNENEEDIPTEVANKKITKDELTESVTLTRKQIRRQELKARLRDGIEEVQKLHRRLFFPYELHTSIGSKILEIASCTSGCTDTSDDETNSSNSDTSTSTCDGVNGIKSGLLLRRQRRKKLPPRRKRAAAAGGGGGPPSSSSSSSSSSSDSSSTSDAFTSWPTTSSSSSDDEQRKPIPSTEKREEQVVPSDVKEEKNEDEQELPAENNYLLRSFNHIYVSTEERRRQQELKQSTEYRQEEEEEVVNSGYITLTGDDSKEETPSTSTATLAPSDNCDVYINYFNNPNVNMYNRSNNSNNTTNSSNTQSNQIAIEAPPITEPPKIRAGLVGRAVEEISNENQSTVVMPSIGAPVGVALPKERIYIQNRYPDISIASDNNNGSVQLLENTEEDEEGLVAQEEYRTGLRKVDEDVDDEDGNNCARTQQFKEWHEVLQLRSYNDELLTVLPYVVIE